jgi:hypothetical protein
MLVDFRLLDSLVVHWGVEAETLCWRKVYSPTILQEFVSTSIVADKKN